MFMLRHRETSHSELETGPRPDTKYSHNWSLPKQKKVISGITLITMINAETQAFYYVKDPTKEGY